MNPQQVSRLVAAAATPEMLAAVRAGVHSLDDLVGVHPAEDGRRVCAASLVLTCELDYVAMLDLLLERGLGPDVPAIEATGLFRIGNVLERTRHLDVPEDALLARLAVYRALAPHAELRCATGEHPISLALRTPRWGGPLMEWLLAHTPALAALDAEHRFLHAMGYDDTEATFSKLKALMDAGVDPDWKVPPSADNAGLDETALFWCLHSKPVPLALLFLFLERGASDPRFLFDLITTRQQNLQRSRAALAAAYLSHPTRRAELAVSAAHGLSPLHLAVAASDQALVQVLLAAGADPDAPALRSKTFAKVKIARGQSPRELARALGAPLSTGVPSSIALASSTHVEDLEAAYESCRALRRRLRELVERLDSLPGMTWTRRPAARALPAEPPQSLLLIADRLWPRRTPHHLSLLSVAWALGGQHCVWEMPGKAAGGFRFADWSQVLTRGVLAFHEDTGTTRFRIDKRGLSLAFVATYEGYASLPLALGVDEFVQRCLDVGGLQYWPYLFVDASATCRAKVCFLVDSLEVMRPIVPDLQAWRVASA